jgi:hypothetical protein
MGMNFSNTQLISVKLIITTDTINLIANYKIIDLESKHNMTFSIRLTANVKNNPVSEHQVNEL